MLPSPQNAPSRLGANQFSLTAFVDDDHAGRLVLETCAAGDVRILDLQCSYAGAKIDIIHHVKMIRAPSLPMKSITTEWMSRPDVMDDDDFDPARIIVWTPLAPWWTPTIMVLSNLVGTGVPSGYVYADGRKKSWGRNVAGFR